MAASESVLAVLGLGNPGPGYRGSRHNLGFRVLARLAQRHRLRLRPQGPELETARWRFGGGGRVVTLARPLTYMNRSGRAALCLCRERGLDPDEILVVVDDLDLPFGGMRLREAGGAGTHNGMRSLLEALGPSFPRLRLGIGPGPPGADLADWVLRGFDDSEQERLGGLLDAAADCVETAVRAGVRAAMNEFNRRPAEGGNAPAGGRDRS